MSCRYPGNKVSPRLIAELTFNEDIQDMARYITEDIFFQTSMMAEKYLPLWGFNHYNPEGRPASVASVACNVMTVYQFSDRFSLHFLYNADGSVSVFFC